MPSPFFISDRMEMTQSPYFCPGHYIQLDYWQFHQTRHSFAVRADLASRSASCFQGMHRTATGGWGGNRILPLSMLIR
jgi:hypothetical protein